MGRIHDIQPTLDTIEEEMERNKKKEKGEFYSLALEDLQSGDVDEELWAICLSHHNFNKKKAAALYIREAAAQYETQILEDELQELREQQERDERRALQQARAEERAQRTREEAEEKANAKKIEEELRREADRERRQLRQEKKRQENAKFKRLAGVDKELIPGSTKFVFIFIRPLIGAIILFLAGLNLFSPFHQVIAIVVSTLISAGGWVLFGSVRALLIPAFRENKGFTKRHENPIKFLRITAFLSAASIILIILVPVLI